MADYVIMSLRAKNLTLSLSEMFGGSGFQSQHIITTYDYEETCVDLQIETHTHTHKIIVG